MVHSSSMALTSLILLTITIAFTVLYFILFFKVWRMTNDVRKLTTHFIDKKTDTVNSLLLAGKTEEAAEMFIAKTARIVAEAIHNSRYMGNYVAYKPECDNAISNLKGFLYHIDKMDMLPQGLSSFEAANAMFNKVYGFR